MNDRYLGRRPSRSLAGGGKFWLITKVRTWELEQAHLARKYPLFSGLTHVIGRYQNEVKAGQLLHGDLLPGNPAFLAIRGGFL